MIVLPWRRRAPDVVGRVKACSDLAESYMKAGEYHEAIDCLHEAIRLQPANPVLRSQLERCHAMKNHFLRVERGSEREVRWYVSARHGRDATGYGRLPVVTAAVMAGALTVLSWQYATVTLVEKVPPVPTALKKRTGKAPAGSRSPVFPIGIAVGIPRIEPSVTSVADGSEASPHSRYSSGGKPGQSLGGTPGARLTSNRSGAHPADQSTGARSLY